MLHDSYSRIIIGGLAGDSGKTIVSCGLIVSIKSRGINVSSFKKGPDYIDSAWLSLASGKPARNLDSFIMGFPAVKESFLKKADKNGINLIEGNRGLFDGVDSKGSHSTAELARLLKTPVIITFDISKVTRTAAALILGCTKLAPDVNIAGVILNRTASTRHTKIVTEAIENETGIPVLGAIPKLNENLILPERHLGLITPDEFERKSIFTEGMKKIIDDNVDVNKILFIAKDVEKIERDETVKKVNAGSLLNIKHEKIEESPGIKIGYFRDKSFSFYYPENFELLEEKGAELISINSSGDKEILKEIDALYIGGGFPEVNVESLASNEEMLQEIKRLADDGLPVYAECGGLIYLARKVTWNKKEYSLAGVLPIDIEMYKKPQGHGYTIAKVDEQNPFFEIGTIIRGHEFHYSKISNFDPWLNTALSITRGAGSINNRDGLIYKNVFASYIHLHTLGTPEWVEGMISIARKFRSSKQSKILVEL